MAEPKKRPGNEVRTELVLLLLAAGGLVVTLLRTCGG